MAAPIFQQQGNLAAVTTGNLTVTVPPVEVTDDILVATLVAWVPNTTTGANTVAAPSGWTKFTPDVTTITGGLIDAEYSFFWRRATSSAEADPVFVRPTGWDTGTDGVWAGRIYVIRGCVTTGNPWDAITNTAISTAANPTFPAVTVSGTERLVVVFGVKADNTAFSTAATGYTAQLELTTTTGTDAGVQSYTIASTGSSVSAVTPTGGTAPAQGGTVYFGVSFKPPAGAITRTATGSGVGTQSATGVVRVLFSRSATGSGVGTQTANDLITPVRSATGNGIGNQTAIDLLTSLRTAIGSGVGTQTASGGKIISQTATGSGSGTQTAIGAKVVLRTAITDGGRGNAIAGFNPRLLNAGSSNSYAASTTEVKGMSFVGNGNKLASVSFALSRRNAGETGLLYAKLYAHTGTYGTTGTGTGSALATSDPVDVTTIPTSVLNGRVNVTFTFPDSDKYLVANGTNYVIGVYYAAPAVVNPISIYGLGAPLDYYSGNASRLAGVWSTVAIDYTFIVESVSAVGKIIKTSTATGSGTGTQSATGVIVTAVLRTATGTGVGTQSATGVNITTNRTATGSGTGSATTTKLRTVPRTATGNGTSSSTADDQLTHFATATGSGTGTSLAHIAVGRFRTGSGTALGTTGGFVTFTVTRIRTATGTATSNSSSVYAVIRIVPRTATGSGSGTSSVVSTKSRARIAVGSGVGSSIAVKYIAQVGINWSYWGTNALLGNS